MYLSGLNRFRPVECRWARFNRGWFRFDRGLFRFKSLGSVRSMARFLSIIDHEIFLIALQLRLDSDVVVAPIRGNLKTGRLATGSKLTMWSWLRLELGSG